MALEISSNRHSDGAWALRVTEITDEVHGLGFIAFIRWVLQCTGGIHRGSITARDEKVNGLDGCWIYEPVKGNRNVVQALLTSGAHVAVIQAPSSAQDLWFAAVLKLLLRTW